MKAPWSSGAIRLRGHDCRKGDARQDEVRARAWHVKRRYPPTRKVAPLGEEARRQRVRSSFLRQQALRMISFADATRSSSRTLRRRAQPRCRDANGKGAFWAMGPRAEDPLAPTQCWRSCAQGSPDRTVIWHYIISAGQNSRGSERLLEPRDHHGQVMNVKKRRSR